MAKHFVAEYNKKYSRNFQGFSPEAEKLLLAYSWPGNVRELAHVLERICIMHDDKLIDVHHLPKEIAQTADITFDNNFLSSFNIPLEGMNLEEVLDRLALSFIKKALQLANGNVSQAAKLLGIPRGTLRYKLEKYQLTGFNSNS